MDEEPRFERREPPRSKKEEFKGPAVPRDQQLKFECPIDMEPFTDDSAYFMKNCEHVFHRECLTNYLKAEISNNRCPIKCCLPTCTAIIASEDMVRNLRREDMDKYHK
jgi:hypothetical protein